MNSSPPRIGDHELNNNNHESTYAGAGASALYLYQCKSKVKKKNLLFIRINFINQTSIAFS
jgi:hypothetical protein